MIAFIILMHKNKQTEDKASTQSKASKPELEILSVSSFTSFILVLLESRAPFETDIAIQVITLLNTL